MMGEISGVILIVEIVRIQQARIEMILEGGFNLNSGSPRRRGAFMKGKAF
jgi:hypothetical protein